MSYLTGLISHINKKHGYLLNRSRLWLTEYQVALNFDGFYYDKKRFPKPIL